jgi:hypothetical protein
MCVELPGSTLKGFRWTLAVCVLCSLAAMAVAQSVARLSCTLLAEHCQAAAVMGTHTGVGEGQEDQLQQL